MITQEPVAKPAIVLKNSRTPTAKMIIKAVYAGGHNIAENSSKGVMAEDVQPEPSGIARKHVTYAIRC